MRAPVNQISMARGPPAQKVAFFGPLTFFAQLPPSLSSRWRLASGFRQPQIYKRVDLPVLEADMQDNDEIFPPLASGGRGQDYRSYKRVSSPTKATAPSPTKAEGKSRLKVEGKARRPVEEGGPLGANVTCGWPYGPKHDLKPPPRPYGYGRPPYLIRDHSTNRHRPPHLWRQTLPHKVHWVPHFSAGSLYLTWSPPRPW